MIFLVLYDERGQCQRVARVSRRQEAGPFLSAGFIEVERAEFERCAALVPEASVDDARTLQRARGLLQQIASTPGTRRVNVETNEAGLERLRQRQRGRLRDITRAYLDDDLTRAQWFRRMVDAINAGHVAASALGVGGFENLTRADRQEIERANEVQAQYLTRFRRELDTLSPAETRARAELYGGAVTTRYWTAHTRARGLPPLPAMPGVRTSCKSNCKCNWNIIPLSGEGNWNCQWRVSAVEHCEECLRRQRVFNPLEIRNGVVQPFNPNGIYA